MADPLEAKFVTEISIVCQADIHTGCYESKVDVIDGVTEVITYCPCGCHWKDPEEAVAAAA